MQATPSSVALAIIHSATVQYASSSANALIQGLHLAAMRVAQFAGIAGAAGTRVRESRVVAIQDGDTFALPRGDEAQVKIRFARADAPEKGHPFYRVYPSPELQPRRASPVLQGAPLGNSNQGKAVVGIASLMPRLG